MTYNNTHGIEAYNQSRYEEVIDSLYRTDGCLDQIEYYRNLSLDFDRSNQGSNEGSNTVCQKFETFCTEGIYEPYLDSNVNYYNISVSGSASFPTLWNAALSIPLKWTQSNATVSGAFRSIGDFPHPGWKEDLAYLLDEGIKLVLFNRDREHACKWHSGEALSLAIPYNKAREFATTSYAPLAVNDT